MTYGADIECFRNGMYTRTVIEAKSQGWLKRKLKQFCEVHGEMIGYVFFERFSDRVYSRSSYRTTDQFNRKAFYDYWD